MRASRLMAIAPPAARPLARGARKRQPADEHVAWLDGIRGAAALFVVLHHMWLAVWPQFPRNAGPWWVAWLLYGHLAVAVFIVVSGFSLALAPLRSGLTLKGGVRRFLRRRAWRILPAYWAALLFSTMVTALVLRPDLGIAAVAKGFVVHGLLLQDVVGSQTPNGAFWSIAVEWQIYLSFPLVLLFARRTSVGAAAAATCAVVLAAHALGRLGWPLRKIDDVTPQFLALFAAGVLAVDLGRRGDATSLRRPLAIAGAAALVACVVAALARGSAWMVEHYFAVDLLFGMGVACLLSAMFAGGGPRARHALMVPPALRLGRFSYSVYLIHGPLVAVLFRHAVAPLQLPEAGSFAVLVVVGLPLILGFCYAFHVAFEAPFLDRRGVEALRTLPAVEKVLRAGRAAASALGRRSPDVAPAKDPA